MGFLTLILNCNDTETLKDEYEQQLSISSVWFVYTFCYGWMAALRWTTHFLKTLNSILLMLSWKTVLCYECFVASFHHHQRMIKDDTKELTKMKEKKNEIT